MLFIITQIWRAGSVFGALISLPRESKQRKMLPSCLVLPSQLMFLHLQDTNLNLSWESTYFILFQGILQFLEVVLFFPPRSTTRANSCPFNPHLSALLRKRHLRVTAQNRVAGALCCHLCSMGHLAAAWLRWHLAPAVLIHLNILARPVPMSKSVSLQCSAALAGVLAWGWLGTASVGSLEHAGWPAQLWI